MIFCCVVFIDGTPAARSRWGFLFRNVVEFVYGKEYVLRNTVATTKMETGTTASCMYRTLLGRRQNRLE